MKHAKKEPQKKGLKKQVMEHMKDDKKEISHLMKEDKKLTKSMKKAKC